MVQRRARGGRGPGAGLTPRTALMFGALGAATAVAITAPFRIGLAWDPAGGSSLLGRVRYAADLYPVTTMGASNLWAMVDGRIIGRADDVPRWGSITPAMVATALFVLVMGLVILLGWRACRCSRLRPEVLLWSGAAAM